MVSYWQILFIIVFGAILFTDFKKKKQEFKFFFKQKKNKNKNK